jgi:hypothetical protein
VVRFDRYRLAQTFFVMCLCAAPGAGKLSVFGQFAEQAAVSHCTYLGVPAFHDLDPLSCLFTPASYLYSRPYGDK